MAMCEELGLATGVQNHYDDIKKSHGCVSFRFSLGACCRRHNKLRGRTRFRSANSSHMDIFEIAFSPRSRNCVFSKCYSARCEKYVLVLTTACIVVYMRTIIIFAHAH